MNDMHDDIRWQDAVPAAPESLRRRVRATCLTLDEERPAPRPARLAARVAAVACALALVLTGALLLCRGRPAPDSLAAAPEDGPAAPLWVETPGGFIDTVYWSPDAEPLYHRTGLCQDLGGAQAAPLPVAGALEKGLAPCPRCVVGGAVYGGDTPDLEAKLREETYWALEGGQTFHHSQGCARMGGYAYGADGMEKLPQRPVSALEALVEGLAPCPECMRDFRLSLDVLFSHADEITVYTQASARWFHPSPELALRDEYADPQRDLIRCTVRQAAAMGASPCPCSYIYPADQTDGRVPETLLTAWSDADEPFYHRMNMCQGVSFATENTVAKWKMVKKRACPVCMDRDRPARDASALSESVAATTVFFDSQDRFYHKDFHCAHAARIDGVQTHTLGVAYSAGKEPCPYCAQ